MVVIVGEDRSVVTERMERCVVCGEGCVQSVTVGSDGSVAVGVRVDEGCVGHSHTSQQASLSFWRGLVSWGGQGTGSNHNHNGENYLKINHHRLIK